MGGTRNMAVAFSALCSKILGVCAHLMRGAEPYFSRAQQRRYRDRTPSQLGPPLGLSMSSEVPLS